MMYMRILLPLLLGLWLDPARCSWADPLSPPRGLPLRGQLAAATERWQHQPLPDGCQYLGQILSQRWGCFRVRIAFEAQGPAAVTLRVAETGEPLQGATPITRSGVGYYEFPGTVYLKDAGPHLVAVQVLGASAAATFKLVEVRLFPAPEGPLPPVAADGRIELPARAATTWSEVMRYEPRPDKNCLGFWGDPRDWPEWVFPVTKPGKYVVQVWQGSPAPGGLPMKVECADWAAEYQVKATGGYHTLASVEVGTVEFKSANPAVHLSIRPQAVRGPVCDITKVVLIPQH